MSGQQLLFALFAAAMAMLWVPEANARCRFALGILAAALLLALLDHRIAPYAPLWAGLLVGAGFVREQPRWRPAATAVLLILVLLLGFGVLPGFHPVALAEPMVVKLGSQPYKLGFRVDKVLAGFALLAFFLPLHRSAEAWNRILLITGITLLGTGAVVFATGLALGYVHFSPGAPGVGFLAPWAIGNLLFTTSAEEGFFRGVIQQWLTTRIGAPAAILAAALLFGLAHFGGGWLYVLLAALAGVGYGVAYELAGRRIEAAMLTHFGLNLLHLLLFSYPAAV